MARKRWSELSERNRRLIVLGGSVEAVLRVVALADLRRRPAEQVRGRKWAWATAITLIGSVGVVPAAYLLVGRRKAGGRYGAE